MDKTLVFDISLLLDKPTGTSEVYTFDGPVNFEEDMTTASNITGRIEIMRIEEGLNVVTKDVNIRLKLKCEKCLEDFSKDIRIRSAERQFFIKKPIEIEDLHDIYLIDKKHQEIDVNEMIRQEIILHFPIVQVCSTGCKGICQICGKNRNKEECNCETGKDTTELKPLAVLKKLLK
jgi:uncharacterized metal-binding protein YceD (DUF177 family)